MRFIYHVLILAQRDLLKFIRDRGRIAATFIFPIIFIGVFGVTLDSGLGRTNLGFNYIDYVFSGILLQTIFQSSFSGIVSLIADREKDFAMSIFVAPVSRYAIVLGKIIGESLVSMCQVVGIMIFGKLIGVSFAPHLLGGTLLICALASLVGASFGILVASRIDDEQNANRVFPFLIFPLIFLSGAFTPVNNLPPVLNILKILNPIYYGVDLMRNYLFAGSSSYSKVVSNSWTYDLTVFVVLGIVFFFLGTYLFTQKEGNK
jgi:ABC-2 type transport system permease protein